MKKSETDPADSVARFRPSASRGRGRKSKIAGIAVVIAAVAYSWAAPRLNDRFDWNLPSLIADEGGNVRLAEDRSPVSTSPAVKPANDDAASGPARPDAQLRFGLLRPISADRYLSPAGLLYTPGSAEGHRVDHVARHTRDQPGRPGKHGVFDGGMEQALVTIDRAYERAKNKRRTTVKKDGRRTIYTVDMGGRIGFIGGREGQRQRNPMARRVRLVVEGNRMITAYPL